MSEIDFLGRGLAFPLARSPQSGGLRMVADDADVEQSILIILQTVPGERVMRPTFGCGIHELVFDVVNTQLIADVKRVVTEALRRFEARIDVLRVEVDRTAVADGKLLVNLDYRVRTTNQTGNLVYPFYFREGS